MYSNSLQNNNLDIPKQITTTTTTTTTPTNDNETTAEPRKVKKIKEKRSMKSRGISKEIIRTLERERRARDFRRPDDYIPFQQTVDSTTTAPGNENNATTTLPPPIIDEDITTTPTTTTTTTTTTHPSTSNKQPNIETNVKKPVFHKPAAAKPPSKHQSNYTWSKEETASFLEQFAIYGADFSLLEKVIPGRSHQQLKLKFKKELRNNTNLLSEVSEKIDTLDIETFATQKATVDIQRKEKEIEKNLKNQLNSSSSGVDKYKEEVVMGLDSYLIREQQQSAREATQNQNGYYDDYVDDYGANNYDDYD